MVLFMIPSLFSGKYIHACGYFQRKKSPGHTHTIQEKKKRYRFPVQETHTQGQ